MRQRKKIGFSINDNQLYHTVDLINSERYLDPCSFWIKTQLKSQVKVNI